MKKRLYIIFTTSIFLSIIYLAIYANLQAGRNLNPFGADTDEIERIEDSIIVNGIRISSDTPMEDEDPDFSNGKIIYDNSFDTIIDYELTKRKTDNDLKGTRGKPNHSINKNKEKVSFNIRIIDNLKVKDSRWHVTRHRIKRGENLWVISRKYRTDHKFIIRLNYIKNPDMLKTGRIIFVPNRNGLSYTIKRGDSISRIAKRYGIKRKRIFSQNNLKKGMLIAGTKIFLPDAKAKRIVKKRYGHNKNHKKGARITRTRKSRRMFSWPLKGRITSTFGKRTDPFTRKKKFHCGLDISARVGTPIRASMSGRAIFSGWKNRYGNVVILKHKNGYITVYAHNMKNLVKEDEVVKEGHIIAYSGMTGAVTGAHLHFEIRKYLTPLNPLRFLK